MKIFQKAEKPRLLFLAIIFLGFIYRLASLLTRGAFRFDEVFSLHFANYPLKKMFRFLIYETNPPLFYFLLHFWLKIIGPTKSEWLIRLPNLIIGLAGIWAIFILGKKLISKRVGLLAAFFVSISVFQIYISSEIRPYPIVFLLSIFSVYFFWQYLENKNLAWLGYLISTILVIYTHLSGWFVFLIINVFFILIKTTKIPFLNNNQPLRKWLILQIIIIFAWLPWLILWLLPKISQGISQSWFFSVPSPYFYFLRNLNDFLIPSSFFPPAFFLLTPIAFIIILSLLTNFFQILKKDLKRDEFQINFIYSVQTLFLFLWLFLPLLICFSLGLYPPLHFLTSTSPAFYLILASGLKNLNLSEKKMFLFLTFISALLLISFVDLLTTPYPTKQIAEFIQKNEKLGDKIIVHVHGEALTLKYYYQGKLPIEGFYPLDDNLDFELKVIKKNWQKVVDEKNVEKLSLSTAGFKRIFLVYYYAWGLDPENLVFKWFLKNNWRMILSEENKFLPYRVFLFER
jgi:4-amino-4-deoxy-L-arabinose transferase-like glycosyltransferase